MTVDGTLTVDQALGTDQAVLMEEDAQIIINASGTLVIMNSPQDGIQMDRITSITNLGILTIENSDSEEPFGTGNGMDVNDNASILNEGTLNYR